MKLSHPSLRGVSTLATAFLALAAFAGACSSNDTTTPPTTPPPPPVDDGGTSTPMDVVIPPPPSFDGGSMTCGTTTCGSSIVGGQLGIACCAGRQMDHCGLNFGAGCIDESDAGFQPPPMRDAGPPPTTDPGCGQATITFNQMDYTLPGCCQANGMCGYYVTQMTSLGCISPDQLPMGSVLPDGPVMCTGDAGPRP